MLIGPCAEAIGASLCWAVGLTLLARPRHPGDHTDHAEGLGAPEGTSRLSFYGGALVFVVGYAFSVSSALSPTPSRNLAMAALSASFPFSLLAQAWLFRWPSATEAGSYLLSFLGATAMQLAAPWPSKGPSEGLDGLRRLEGFGQCPAAALGAYLLACLMCLFAGMALVSVSVWDASPEKPFERFVDPPRLALAFAVLCGAGAVGAELALAIGTEAAWNHSEAQYGTFALLLGFALLLLVVRCCWECFQSLRVPLPKLAVLVFGSAALLRVLQAQVLFREISWEPTLLVQGAVTLPSPLVCLAGAACLLASMLLASYHLILEYTPCRYSVLPREQGSLTAQELGLSCGSPVEAQHLEAQQRSTEWALSEIWKKGWQWLGVVVCAISYYMGITRALFLINPPEVLATEQPVERSNLQLIVYLGRVGMPLASLMVLVFSAIIPLFKFATTFLVMHPPSTVTPQQHMKFCQLLCALSPYQMSDIFLVMLILAYLNTGFAAGGHGSGYECTLCSGFKSFFFYCFVSVLVAQVLEIEHAEAVEEVGDSPDTAMATTVATSPAAEDSFKDRPGIYVLLKRAAVVPTVHMSGTKEIRVELKAGDMVEVLEVVQNPGEQRIRGRTAQPPGWISLLDLEDGHRWARRCEGRPEVEQSLVKLLFFFIMWLLCSFTLLVLPAPPMSLQARSGGVIVYRQEPTLSELFHALWVQSRLFSGLMVVVLLVTPLLFVLVALARILLFRHFLEPFWIRRLWLCEQILKPWVMGDVAAVAITSLFLSIQEPSTDFVFLCVRLAMPPLGFLACLGQGVACWGLRWCTPPLQPGAEARHSSAAAAAVSSTVPGEDAPLTPLRAAFEAAWKLGASSPEGSGSRWSGSWIWSLVSREIYVWLFWFTIFWQLGPHEPPAVHSLEDLNTVLHQEVPRINKILMENLPHGIGDCKALVEHRPENLQNISKAHCNEMPMTPLEVSPVGFWAKVVFLDGISSLRIQKLRVLPEKTHLEREWPERSASGQRWAIDIGGQFSDLKIWARAVKGQDELLNGYVCCRNPYHVGIQLSVLCSEPEGFSGNLTVDDFHIDQVNLNTHWSSVQMSDVDEQSMLEIDMGGDADDLIHQEIQRHLESVIVEKTGGAKPVQAGLPAVSLAAILNKVLRFNGGEERCPKPS